MKQLDFIGIWRLVSYLTFLDGKEEGFHPYSESPIGYLIYTLDGYMSVHIMHGNKTQYGGYVGKYQIDANAVIHHPEVCGFPAFIGEPQVRHFQFSGNRLTLKCSHFSEEHQCPAKSEIVWERVEQNVS